MIDIKDFLVNILDEKIDADISLYTGRQDEKEEKSLLISNDTKQDGMKLYNQNYFKQNISVVIRWNGNYTETRHKALEIYNVIKSISKVLYDENTLIVRCLMTDDCPKDANGTDKIYAQKIDFQIQYVTK